jgi:ABC-2 type transport system permease protein
MFSVLKKELKTFFGNAIGYIVIGIFLLLNGLLLWFIPGEYNIIETGYANVDGLFYLAPWLFLILCPAISMRFFAEEKQSGTWELLVSKPISKTEIVLGKFFAGWLLVMLALVPTLIYYFTVYFIAEPIGNIDSGQFWGSFIGLMFLTAVYISIGTYASSLTNNQIVSFVIAVVLSFFLYYGLDVTGSFFNSGNTIQFISGLGINTHYQSMSRGVIDSHDVAYFSLISLIFILLTVRRIRK